MEITEGLMWVMILISSIFSVITTIVTFGMVEYTKQLRIFTNFLPLEISLSITLFLWGVNSLYRNHGKSSKRTFIVYLIMGVILLGFIFMGVY
jgi:hypothetical protein